jgi:hypothetical protein
MSWEDFQYQLVQVDSSKKMRESKWIAVCQSCQCERTISYCQAYNIKNGHTNTCSECREYKPNSGQISIGNIPWNRGINFKPIRSYNKNKEYMEIINTFGMIFTQEITAKQRNAKLGKFREKASNWQGGKTSERKTLMQRNDYKQLRKDCFGRDNFICQICNVRGGSLEMDHIKEWCNYPELRYELSNVRTLCKECHKTTDNFAHKAIKKRVA